MTDGHAPTDVRTHGPKIDRSSLARSLARANASLAAPCASLRFPGARSTRASPGRLRNPAPFLSLRVCPLFLDLRARRPRRPRRPQPLFARSLLWRRRRLREVGRANEAAATASQVLALAGSLTISLAFPRRRRRRHRRPQSASSRPSDFARQPSINIATTPTDRRMTKRSARATSGLLSPPPPPPPKRAQLQS